ncbi:MAG TPA: GNAT family N-acetyltransferase [Candidatus Elarobacter sp.]
MSVALVPMLPEHADRYRETLERSFFVVDGDEVVGELHLRFGLTPSLEREGGHVDCQIHPAARNKGYGTAALRLGLARLAEHGIASALVTIDEGNPASRRYTVATIVARALRPDEWEALRDLRLRALREERGMFFRTYDEEASLPENAWRDRISGPRHQVFGLFAGGGLVGITAVGPHFDDPTGTVAGLAMSYLAPPYRGHGYSRFLYAPRLAWIRAHPDYRRVFVSHRRSNVPSQRAIERHGFRRTGAAPHRWPDGAVEDEVFYELNLDDT